MPASNSNLLVYSIEIDVYQEQNGSASSKFGLVLSRVLQFCACWASLKQCPFKALVNTWSKNQPSKIVLMWLHKSYMHAATYGTNLRFCQLLLFTRVYPSNIRTGLGSVSHIQISYPPRMYMRCSLYKVTPITVQYCGYG